MFLVIKLNDGRFRNHNKTMNSRHFFEHILKLIMLTYEDIWVLVFESYAILQNVTLSVCFVHNRQLLPQQILVKHL